MIETYQEYLRYDAETGKLFWIKRPSNRVCVGDEAGSINYAGYKMIRLNGKLIMAHRIVWHMIYGVQPIGEIDHINGNTLDNRVCNLRIVDRFQQLMNIKVRKDNTSGVKGVRFDKSRNKWIGRITARGKIIHKRFSDFQDAVNFRNKMQDSLHGEYARKATS